VSQYLNCWPSELSLWQLWTSSVLIKWHYKYLT
jgi:hypothetical protein